MPELTGEPPISACVITLNEEANIERCLNSVQWVDEIVVVDSGSSDRTRSLAEELGARVLVNEWPGHVQQKQFATDRASNDWILSLDADEEVSPDLRRSIQRGFQSRPDPGTCFQVNRLSRYLGRWMKHGSWHPDWIVRLFHRTATEWGGVDPHDRILPTRRVERLDGHLYHYPYDNLSDHLQYLDYYTTLMAEEKDRNGETGSIGRAILHGGFKFVRDYLLKRGFLDGGPGLINAVMGSYYVTLKYLKLWERQSLDVRGTTSYPKDSPP